MKNNHNSVLVPTDEPNFSLGFIDGYKNIGLSVSAGQNLFFTADQKYDLVHFQWPEEYSDWTAPSVEQLVLIKDRLCYWQRTSTLFITVHNIHPHSANNEATIELYNTFFDSCSYITHFTSASREIVLELYPTTNTKRHFVIGFPNYMPTLKRQKQRGSRRAEMNLSPDDFVILTMGRLRSAAELNLIQTGFDSAEIPKKRLLMAGKIDVRPKTFHSRLSTMLWKAWLKKINAIVDSSYYAEEDLSQLLDSSDVVVLPRINTLNSAVLFLAMTFGKMVIAPDCTAYPEFLKNTNNLIYKTGDGASLAQALTNSALMDYKGIGRENAIIAQGWDWDAICRRCIEPAMHLIDDSDSGGF